MRAFFRFGFLLTYVAALSLFLVGTFGLFGAEQDPLSGIFLLPLGFPWVGLIQFAPEQFWPWLAALTPSVNLIIIWMLTRRKKSK